MIYFTLTVLLCTVMFAGVLGAPFVFLHQRSNLHGYTTDMFFAVLNGLLGVSGVTFYLLNIPILGQIGTLDPFTTPSSVLLYVGLNVLRFFCWYGEFLTSFCFLICMRNFVFLTLLRYSFHTFNFICSIVSFGITIDPRFPARSFPGYSFAPPVLWQSLIVHYVLGSYAFIMTSRLYRVDNAVLWATITSPFLGVTSASRHAAASSSRASGLASRG